VGKHVLGDALVVVDEVPLGDLRVGEEHLVLVRQLDVVTVDPQGAHAGLRGSSRTTSPGSVFRRSPR
jgi:hypothetical protein